MAGWVGSGSVSGAGTSRNITVTNATAQGDTLLLVMSFSAAGLSASAVIDSKGNTWVQDGSFTTVLPYLQAYRVAGLTGGPGGGKSAALAPGDTLTVTTPATTGVMAGSVTSYAVGALDAVSAVVIAAAQVTGSVAVTPVANGDLCVAANVNPAASSALNVAAPFTMLDSRQPGVGGSWLSFTTDQLAAGAGAGAAQTQTMNWTGSANWRGIAWAFLPAIAPVTGTGALAAKKITLAGAGTYTPGVTGTGALAAKKIKLAGAGTYTPPPTPITGTGAISAKKIKLAGAGTYTPPPTPITGTGAISAKKITLAGLGTAGSGITGTGAISAKKIKLAGLGTASAIPGVTGTGAISAKKITLAGAGTFTPYVAATPRFVPAPDLLPIIWDGLSLNDGDRGDGLTTVVTNVDGWYGSPPLSGGDLVRQLTDGAIFGFKTVAARVVVVSGSVVANDVSGRAALNQFARDLAARSVKPEPADLFIGEDQGAGDGSFVMLAANVRADSSQLALAWAGRLYFTYQAELTAADPRLYEAAWQSLTVTPTPAGGQTGRVYPWTPQRSYASADLPNAARMLNDGSVPAPVVITYNGDLSESRLTDGINTVHMAALTAGQQITVNSETLNAYAPGGSSRASYVMAGSTPLLIPAESNVQWSLYGTGGGSVTLTWRGVFA